MVRAQDSVTIPVMDNDSMAEGIPLVLDPGSVKVLNGEDAAFASGNVIRYVPQERNPRVEQVRVIEYAVYPIGMRDRAQTGRVSVTVAAADPRHAEPAADGAQFLRQRGGGGAADRHGPGLGRRCRR